MVITVPDGQNSELATIASNDQPEMLNHFERFLQNPPWNWVMLAAILTYPRMLCHYDEFIYVVWSVSISCAKVWSPVGVPKVLWVLFRTPHVSHVHPQCKRNRRCWNLKKAFWNIRILFHALTSSVQATSSIFYSMIKIRNEKAALEISWNAFEQKGRWFWPSFVLTHSLASSWFWKFTKAHRRPCPSVLTWGQTNPAVDNCCKRKSFKWIASASNKLTLTSHIDSNLTFCEISEL